ncbi:MAG: NAD(P)H-hydrate epimerase [Phycisphaerales bacterium]|nr:NAD(P)H-hydrate epimerase [Phycisphaerales bacterium]
MTPKDDIALTRQQIREVDRRAIEEYGIPGIVLMENAGRNAAIIVRRLYNDEGKKERCVALICGRGNNGGDGFVIARHLNNMGIRAEILLACDPNRLTGDALTNFRIVEKMGLPRHAFDTPERIAESRDRFHQASIIVDAVLGTGFSGRVRPSLDEAIDAINHAGSNARIVAIDVPSGLDCDSGQPSNATVRANTTVTFVAKKVGFLLGCAAEYTGEIHVAEIGAPPEIIQAVLKGGASG